MITEERTEEFFYLMKGISRSLDTIARTQRLISDKIEEQDIQEKEKSDLSLNMLKTLIKCSQDNLDGSGKSRKD